MRRRVWKAGLAMLVVGLVLLVCGFFFSDLGDTFLTGAGSILSIVGGCMAFIYRGPKIGPHGPSHSKLQ